MYHYRKRKSENNLQPYLFPNIHDPKMLKIITLKWGMIIFSSIFLCMTLSDLVGLVAWGSKPVGPIF